MKRTKIRTIAGSIAICILCAATAAFSVLAVTKAPAAIEGLQTYANGFVTVDSEKIGEGYTAGITELTENFFNPNVGYSATGGKELIPGSSDSGTITFKNNSPDCQIGIHFWAESTPETMENGDKPYEIFYNNHPGLAYSPEKLKLASDKLVSDYMELEIKDPNGTVVYSGKLNGPSSPVNIGKLNPGASAKYTFTLKVPTSLESVARPGSYEEEQGLTHGYENTVAMIDWHFSIEITMAPTQTTTTTPTTTTTTTPPPVPGTGEEPNGYIFAAVACGLSALAVFYVTFCGGRRRRKEEE